MTTLPSQTPFYGGGQAQNPANVISVTSAPSNNAALEAGIIAANPSTGTIYISYKKGAWSVVGGGSSDVNTLTGDSGGAISPTGGTISLLGTANQITTTGSGGGHSITFSLPSAVTLPGSLIVTTTLNVSGLSTLAALTQVGTANINASGAAVTTIGTGGTGAVNIGNATGNTAVTGTLTATALKATTIDTNVAAAQLSLTATTIAATGSDTDVSLNLTAKGAGAVIYSQSKAGADQNIQITNSDNTAADSKAGLQIAVGGSTSLGDPYVSFQISGVGASTMTMGLDNSASDTFVISNSAAIGTSNALTLTQAGALGATTSITAGTTLTATSGAITATNGNLVLGTAGNKIVSTSVGSGTSAGANSFGTATLSGGTVTVSTTAVTASSIIILTRQSVGATGANDLGILSVGTIAAGTSFVIDSWTVTNATALQTDDVSVIGWMIIN